MNCSSIFCINNGVTKKIGTYNFVIVIKKSILGILYFGWCTYICRQGKYNLNVQKNTKYESYIQE